MEERNDRPTVLERAFELAKSGKCTNVAEIRLKLEGEGYAGVKQQFSGRALRIQLAKLCAEAQPKG